MRDGNVSTQRLVESKIIIQQTVPEHKLPSVYELVNAQLLLDYRPVSIQSQVSNQMGQ